MASRTSAIGFTTCFLFLLQALAPSYAYIPAQATNDTSVATTNVSTLFLQWFGNGCVLLLFVFLGEKMPVSECCGLVVFGCVFWSPGALGD